MNIMATTGAACYYSDDYPPEANANRAVGERVYERGASVLRALRHISIRAVGRAGGPAR